MSKIRTTAALAACFVACLMASIGCRESKGPPQGWTKGLDGRWCARADVVAKLIGGWQLGGVQNGDGFTKYDSTPVWLEFKADGSWAIKSEDASAPYANRGGKWKYKQGTWEYGGPGDKVIKLSVWHDSSPQVEEEWRVGTNFKNAIGLSGVLFKNEAVWGRRTRLP